MIKQRDTESRYCDICATIQISKRGYLLCRHYVILCEVITSYDYRSYMVCVVGVP
jgi:hypothetical protein